MKKEKDMISCVITTYNRPVYALKRAIDSVINQTYDSKEIIVVNDYPENNKLACEIEDLIKLYNKNDIKYIKLKENSGACYARNVGVKNSKGSFLAFLDDDDEWLPNKLEEQIKMFVDDEIGMIYCDGNVINGNKIKINSKINPNHYGNDYKEILLGNYIGGVSYPLIKKSVFLQVGEFDVNLPSNQDTDLYIRIMKKFKAVRCEKVLLNQYITPVSITTNMKKKYDGYKYLFKKYAKEYEKYKDVYIQKNINTGNVFIKLGEFKLANEFYSTAINCGVKRFHIYKNKIKYFVICLIKKII